MPIRSLLIYIRGQLREKRIGRIHHQYVADMLYIVALRRYLNPETKSEEMWWRDIMRTLNGVGEPETGSALRDVLERHGVDNELI